jgi:hypothetical protein
MAEQGRKVTKFDMKLRYGGRCRGCGRDIAKGEAATWLGPRLGVAHEECAAVKVTRVPPEWISDVPRGTA